MNNQKGDIIKKCEKIIRDAGDILKNNFFSKKDFSAKQKRSKSDLVTEFDLKVEDFLTNSIKSIFYNIQVISEEKSESSILLENKSYAIIDPLDGTNNFCIGIPYFSISVYIKHETIGEIGFIYNPIANLMISGCSYNKTLLFNDKKVGIKKYKKKIDLTDISCAVISDYNISYKITEPLKTKLYEFGMKRVMSNWSPSHDFMNLLLYKIDCVIILNNEIFSQKAGIFLSKLNSDFVCKNSYIKINRKNIKFKIFAHKDNIKFIVNNIINDN